MSKKVERETDKKAGAFTWELSQDQQGKLSSLPAPSGGGLEQLVIMDFVPRFFATCIISSKLRT